MSHANRRALAAIVVLAAVALTALGLSGAYAYGSNYNVYRGFNAVAPRKGAGTGRLETERFYSPAMHKRVYYLVYLPPGYTPRRRYPVYYLLHGEPGKPRGFIDIASMETRLDNLISRHDSRPMILVYPNGQIDNDYYSDSEWANTPSGDFESYVVEVVHQVDHRFSTIASRNDRVIAGFSMGAYGAMNIGLHHLDLFADIQAWSGYYIETHNGVFAHASPQTMVDNSPGEYVAGLGPEIHRDPVSVFMFVGNHDSDEPQQAPMARALREAGAHVGDRVYVGGHDWDMWWPRIDPMIMLASFDTLHPPTRMPLARGPIVPVSARFGALGGHHHHHHHHHRSHARTASSSSSTSRHTVVRVVIRRRLRDGATTLRVLTTPVRRSRHRTLRLIGALLLALVASALINLGFVLQHRGHTAARRQGGERLRDVFLTPMWLLGQLVGWTGWAGQIVAVALVPLTLVQAVGAGSLALSVPLAAWLFEYRVSRSQIGAIVAIAVALSSLPVGAGTHGHLSDGLLIGIALLFSFAAAIGCVSRSTAVRATAAGVLYGVADAAVKADAIELHQHGAAGLLSGWTVVAALATLGGFLAFQAALRGRDAVQPLSLMAAFSAITGVVIGVAAFREPLGSRLDFGVLHVAAIVVVLSCVPPLVRAQQRLAGDSSQATDEADALRADGAAAPTRDADRTAPWWASAGRITLAVTTHVAAGLATIVAGIVGVGLLYTMRNLHLLGLGPRVHDALPLLALAGYSSQPLLRVLVAFGLAGLVLGVTLSRMAPASRMLVAAPIGALLLLVASDASYALSNNVLFLPVLAHREPGLGPWLQWLLLAGTCALPGLRSAGGSLDADSLGPPMTAMPA